MWRGAGRKSKAGQRAEIDIVIGDAKICNQHDEERPANEFWRYKGQIRHHPEQHHSGDRDYPKGTERRQKNRGQAHNETRSDGCDRPRDDWRKMTYNSRRYPRGKSRFRYSYGSGLG